MKLTIQENDDEYKLIKDKPYKDLVNKDTLVSVGVLFFVLILVKLYAFIPLIIFFVALATVQTIEDNFILVIKKKTKEIIIYRYYMGKWKFKEAKYQARNYGFIQVEKKVTSIKEQGQFSIRLLSDPPDSDKKGEVVVLMKNLDLEAIEQSKIICFLLELIYVQKIKYKMEIT